ncbi:hypothetical protein B0H67DRAFT_598384 [Lasiosphaeris hirsuta]|uniref:Deoxyribose-phosphate aldolase n=1 Tax=Lasiosphaeris hirsuta TaxID=260670 RepID=A0AA40AZL5_9PEZI|nr:hypothetical protein B0H67DRAFT_598384 [Lasiosphaeris hirsuta]
MSTSLGHIASSLEYSLLHPIMTDADLATELQRARDFKVAAVCVKPYSIPTAVSALQGTNVLVCTVVGFPYGDSTTNLKVFEAREAMEAGAHEVELLINVGKVLGGDWDYVRNEIQAVNQIVAPRGDLKVIFESHFLSEQQIVELCRICTGVGVAAIKTSSGYGYVQDLCGSYRYPDTIAPQLELMKNNCGQGEVKIEAALEIRRVREIIFFERLLGVSRVTVGEAGAAAIMGDARQLGVTDVVQVVWIPLPS